MVVSITRWVVTVVTTCTVLPLWGCNSNGDVPSAPVQQPIPAASASPEEPKMPVITASEALVTPPANEQASATAKLKTVRDYFLAMPDKYLKTGDNPEDDASSVVREKLLKQLVTVLDVENGYVSTTSIYPDLCGYEMTIFRRSKGAHLVAMNLSCTVGDQLTLLDPDQNWKDVTDEQLPISVKPQSGRLVKLPRYGRTIEINNQETQHQVKVTFVDDQFRVVQ